MAESEGLYLLKNCHNEIVAASYIKPRENGIPWGYQYFESHLEDAYKRGRLEGANILKLCYFFLDLVNLHEGEIPDKPLDELLGPAAAGCRICKVDFKLGTEETDCYLRQGIDDGICAKRVGWCADVKQSGITYSPEKAHAPFQAGPHSVERSSECTSLHWNAKETSVHKEWEAFVRDDYSLDWIQKRLLPEELPDIRQYMLTSERLQSYFQKKIEIELKNYELITGKEPTPPDGLKVAAEKEQRALVPENKQPVLNSKGIAACGFILAVGVALISSCSSGSGSSSSSSSSNMTKCPICGRSVSKWTITKQGMCDRCKNNYKSAKGALNNAS